MRRFGTALRRVQLELHLAHDDGLSTADRILDGVVLTVTVVGAPGLIWVARDQRSDVTTGT